MAVAKNKLGGATLLDTRKTGRYAARENVSLFMTPVGLDVKIRGVLIDVNRLGGIGLFVQNPSPLDQIPLDSILKPWRITRNVKKGEVDFTVRFMHVISQTLAAKAGLRFSSAPRQAPREEESIRFLQGTRRKAKRAFKGGPKAFLEFLECRVDATLLDVGSDDGAGVLLKPAAAASLTWAQIFRGGPELHFDGHTFSCVVQRIGIRDRAVSVGLVVPGLAAALDLEEHPPEKAASDQQLVDLLETILSKKPAKTR